MADNDRAAAIARLLYGENRANLTEPEALAMGDTILNRPMYQGYPDTPEETIAQHRGETYQYSPMDPSNPNYPVIQAFGPEDQRWQTYINYANKVLDPARQRSAYTHYFSGEPPTWAGQLENLTQIGSHWFGREKRRLKHPGGAGVIVQGYPKGSK